jgi:prephenate dehydrogenase
MAEPGTRRAGIVGTGLIGGSLGMALRDRGWHVTGEDTDHEAAARALALGAIDVIGIDATAELTFVAAPVGVISATVQRLLQRTSGVVTDVGSVKASVVHAVADPRFVGGHPMAGSEQLGVDGADADLFEGAAWVLTPVAHTDPTAYALVRSVVSSLGAEVVALAPERHDALVAVVSHVPHLTAAALMDIAGERAEEHSALLRLAAGGFRDMTRIAAGSPGIWPDICQENRTAIVEVIERLLGTLAELRDAVAQGRRDELLSRLTEAQATRLNLPGRVGRPAEVAEVRVPVPDRPGVLAEVTTLASELGVNIADLEIAHSSEGQAGVLILLVDTETVDQFRSGLVERGYRPAVQALL